MAEKAGAIAVTGAARGIGAAIACELARRGFTVGCLSRGARLPDGAEATERMIAVDCDVADDASIARALDELAGRAGGLRGLVNNAGIHKEGPSDAIAMADYDALMAINARAVFVGCRAAFAHLKAGGGTIVNIGSCARARARRDRAARRRLRPLRRIPVGQCQGDQRARPQRDVRARGLWRRAALYAAYLACVREISAGLRLDRHHLGDQFPRREAAHRFRHRGAKAPPAAARRRGRARRAGDHRARCRLRRDPHDDALHARTATA
jgi:NAD(P)-dependent dehydrogenase (short-subunit alcohol dehydrogenase family)